MLSRSQREMVSFGCQDPLLADPSEVFREEFRIVRATTADLLPFDTRLHKYLRDSSA